MALFAWPSIVSNSKVSITVLPDQSFSEMLFSVQFGSEPQSSRTTSSPISTRVTSCSQVKSSAMSWRIQKFKLELPLGTDTQRERRALVAPKS